MKKLSIVLIVLALGTGACADTAWLEVDPADAKEIYWGNDIITINLMADQDVRACQVGALTSDGGGMALGPWTLHPYFNMLPYPGEVVNAGDPYVLIESMSAMVSFITPPVPAGVIASFEYQVPDIARIITIDDYVDNDHQPWPYLTRVLFDDWSWIEEVGPLVIPVVPEPTTPPVADADGPYIIYVGDTLTLDASGSTDDGNDIVSYMWDLDDDGTYETDANDQAVFDVNYTCLQSLGLLIDNTYNIHLQVTDSQGQSDTNDTTLTILPKPALEVAVDIKPGSCPNPVNVKSSGVLPVAILGTADVNVLDIDPASIQLAGVGAIRHNFEDVATPVSDVNDCNCTKAGADGFLDLTLKFKTQDVVEAIGEVNDGDVLPLELTGVLFGESPIEGNDCVLIRGKFKPFNKADTNRDGVVDLRDVAIFAENWLQSTIVED